MLTDDELIIAVRRLAAVNQTLPSLLLLAQVEQPAATRAITDKAAAIGFRNILSWNVTDILRKASFASLVAQLPDGWRLLDPGREQLAAQGISLEKKVVIQPSDSVVPRELFDGTRRYIERVVVQINASYDSGLFDCCAVMCRRLAETLIIEVYEKLGRAADIKAKDGNFMMLNGLLTVLFGDSQINLGRNSRKGLEALKELGDKSAHNRRFNARENDIDDIRTGLRTAAEELLHLAQLAN